MVFTYMYSTVTICIYIYTKFDYSYPRINNLDYIIHDCIYTNRKIFDMTHDSNTNMYNMYSYIHTYSHS